jgi:hypothetical protein
MDLDSLKVQVHIHKISQSQSVLGLGWFKAGGGGRGWRLEGEEWLSRQRLLATAASRGFRNQTSIRNPKSGDIGQGLTIRL